MKEGRGTWEAEYGGGKAVYLSEKEAVEGTVGKIKEDLRRGKAESEKRVSESEWKHVLGGENILLEKSVCGRRARVEELSQFWYASVDGVQASVNQGVLESMDFLDKVLVKEGAVMGLEKFPRKEVAEWIYESSEMF
jgi:hypothetical protein